MRDRPEFDSTRPDEVELTAEEQAEVDVRMARKRRVDAEPEPPNVDDGR